MSPSATKEFASGTPTAERSSRPALLIDREARGRVWTAPCPHRRRPGKGLEGRLLRLGQALLAADTGDRSADARPP